MKPIKLATLFLAIAVLGMIWSVISVPQVSGETKAEQIINAFTGENQIQIEQNTEEYMAFMKGILLGEYPELTGEDSKYINGQEELDLILDYVVEKTSPLFRDYPVEVEFSEASAEATDLNNEPSLEVLSTYNRQNAIDYAYSWWNRRNSSYPDFGSNDCTNFVSQAVREGGYTMHGTHTCRAKSTQTEWFARSNTPSWNCLGSNRNFVWSTSWSVVYDFRQYFTYHNSHATNLGWTTNHVTARNLLSAGDVVQLQRLENGNWVSYHNMLITKKDSNDLFMTYHSTDTKDKKLREIPAGSSQRYVLIRFP